MPLQSSFKLNSGYSIPAVGLGTKFKQSKPNEVKNAVATALAAGYRHIDAAACYDNEEEVGAGMKESGVSRSDIFVTGKLWNTHHKPEDVERHIDTTLRDLQTDYLDLYLIHFPVSFQRTNDTERFPVNPATEEIHVIDVPIIETWKAMEALVKKGKVRSIGVSNFTRQKIEDLWEKAEIKPSVNQIEAHPYLQQPELLKWCKEKACSADDDAAIKEIAASLGKPVVTVLLSWAVQRGTVVLTKSVTPARIKANFEVFELPQEAFQKINALDRAHRYNFPIRLGVDIFGESSPEALRKGVEDWKAAQRKLKSGAK
ncbi:hypothetical protein JX265_004970 [Neoarthrinium moseri]|uniref:NADP-dependent oxidoreductase domain-containing protein n=1 Tax=Neoarthrinium moseri TaxID=1658444 RepID=A0A9P9WPG3_9PEZI|nr:uncharacterized protein JN550_012694 [Neoarthrinium moseri]KAI1858410.1 hypothetical protein JN550_012694 [Neoarthrinium moseri]KAI1873348.1 hypothetical protein JX265_004970 [Neoarthrinium moseri]